MPSLYSIAELAHRNVFGEKRSKAPVSLEEFIATAKMEYATALWIHRHETIRMEGSYEMPTNLISEEELPINDNRIDISSLKYLKGLPGDIWLRGLGGDKCECKYIKSTDNLVDILCDDDSIGNHKRFVIRGKSIVFVDKTPDKKVTLIYANTGSNIDGDVDVDEYIGSRVRDKLLQVYGNRQAGVDSTNNQNPDK